MINSDVILITGSSRGLGAYAAEGFSSLGYTVVVNYSKSAQEAEALVHKIKSRLAGSEATAIRADVSKRSEVKGMFDEIYGRFGRCDVLINMAGVNLDGPFTEMTDEQWDRVVRTILTGTFICGQEFAVRYRGDNGRIINIGAVTATTGRKNGANYCSARAGVLNLTKCMALELAPGISVNTVTPGYIGTDEVMTRHSLHIKENHEKAVSRIPAGILGTPEDVFKAMDFLVRSSSYITGQNIIVDGGLMMR
ncbi:MAG: SDR family oxidoreductase [Spirochaetes bacterium]|jgi:NAD(P)-dependent dehydrogenase (short-subunit alcohol dehydrogenase family)|nr:SDR family oxidoreductase [Spirochaetota bacterium]